MYGSCGRKLAGCVGLAALLLFAPWHTSPWHGKRSRPAAAWWSRFHPAGNRGRPGHAAARRQRGRRGRGDRVCAGRDVSRSRQYRRRRVHGRASGGRTRSGGDRLPRSGAPSRDSGTVRDAGKPPGAQSRRRARHGSRFGGRPSTLRPLALERRRPAGGQDRRAGLDAGRETGRILSIAWSASRRRSRNSAACTARTAASPPGRPETACCSPTSPARCARLPTRVPTLSIAAASQT